ncbi:hypothetical protein BDY17DRAFT_321432 [Neohortaea acidophila]|uniref:Uncharacterized protein n=1 Tax=Neohortaea acidophila TaxID=245834 RepID=A0A6A6Q3X3_9PEZI|nr:uncharacterized protein BDY17DRAFT_321432 [Neohortaea acidophila]KAF2486656.1 hypothetical protein BDY17DRAFT_321432 [Neohortaea acidophila]
MDEKLFKIELHALQQHLADMTRRRYSDVPRFLDPFASQPEKVDAPLPVMAAKSSPLGPLYDLPQVCNNTAEHSHTAADRSKPASAPLDVIARQIFQLQASVSELEDRFDALDPNRFTPPASMNDNECTSPRQEPTATSSTGTASTEQSPSLVAPNGQRPFLEQPSETGPTNNTSEMPAEISPPLFPSPARSAGSMGFRDSEIVRLAEQLRTAQARLETAETQIADQARWISFAEQDRLLSWQNQKRQSCQISELEVTILPHHMLPQRYGMQTGGLISNFATVPNPSQGWYHGPTAQPGYSAWTPPYEDYALKCEELKKEISQREDETQYWEDLCEEKDALIFDQRLIISRSEAENQTLHREIARLQDVKGHMPRRAGRAAGKQRNESIVRQTLSDSAGTTVRAFSPPSVRSYHPHRHATTARKDYTTGAPFFPRYWTSDDKADRAPPRSRDVSGGDDDYGRRRAPPPRDRRSGGDRSSDRPRPRRGYDSEEDARRKPSPRDDASGRGSGRGSGPRRESPRAPVSREKDKYDDGYKPRRRPAGDDYDDPPPPRRSQSDRYPPEKEALPPRKDTVRDYARDNDARPRDSKYGDRERDRDRDREAKPRRRRSPRDDRDRGYRSDGRDDHRRRDKERRERDRDRDRDRDRGHRKSDRARSADHGSGRRDRERDRGEKRGGGGAKDIMEKGKTHWKTVEPVAKPLLGALAKAYLDGGGRA